MYRALSPVMNVVPVTSVVPVAGDVPVIVCLTSFSPCNWCCSCGECCHVRSVVTATNTFPVTGVVWFLTQMSEGFVKKGYLEPAKRATCTDFAAKVELLSAFFNNLISCKIGLIRGW